MTKKPILAKGIHESDDELKQAFGAGADYALVVGRVPEIFKDKVIVEPYTVEELSQIPESVKCLWNSRDLKTGGKKTETFEMARKVWGGWLCQASNIQKPKDIYLGADAVLVGQNLEGFSLLWGIK